jgi:hypothetical protein
MYAAIIKKIYPDFLFLEKILAGVFEIFVEG